MTEVISNSICDNNISLDIDPNTSLDLYLDYRFNPEIYSNTMDESKILSLTNDCFSHIFSFLGLKNLALLSMTSTEMQKTVFECTREIRDEKLFASMNFLKNFSNLTLLQIFNIKNGYNEFVLNVIDKQEHLKSLLMNKIDDRESIKLDLSKMHGLEELTVDWAKFMHNVELSPNSIENHLRYLKLHNMAFSDFYFNGFVKKYRIASKLKYLDLSFCKNIISPNIGEFAPNIIKVDLSNTSIQNETIYNILDNCKELKILIVDNCDTIGNNGRLKILNHSKLEEISMKLCNSLTHMTIADCPSLKKIDLSKAELNSESICQIFHDNPSVPEIIISEAFRAFESPSFSLYQKDTARENNLLIPLKIRKLDLSLTSLTSSLLEQFILAGGQYYEELNLNFTHITDLFLPNNVTLPNLKVLDVSNSLIIDEALERFLKICPSLEYLNSFKCDQLTPNIIIASNSLKKLNYEICNCNNQTIQELLKRCPNLEWLSIKSEIENLEINSDSLVYLSISGSTNLQSLQLGKCPKLEILSANSLVSLTKFNLIPEGKNIPLKKIELKQSPQIIGRVFKKEFPSVNLEGFEYKNEAFDRNDPTVEELRQSYYAYQNLHSTHILVILINKITELLEKANNKDAWSLKSLRASIQLQLGHYRSIQGRDIQEGIKFTKESLKFYQDQSLETPEKYFRILFAYETLLSLYKLVPGATEECEDISQKLENWKQINKIDSKNNSNNDIDKLIDENQNS